MYPGVGSSWREGVDGFIVNLHGDRGASNTDKDSKTTTQRRWSVIFMFNFIDLLEPDHDTAVLDLVFS